MNKTDYIKYIQAQIKDKDYDDYIHAFNEYKGYLENCIKENPNDVEVVCQLSSVYHELQYGINTSTDMMEKLLVNVDCAMSSEEKARLYINLAFLYDENGDNKNLLRCLNAAIGLNTNLPNAYDALGRFYVKKESYDKAITLFEKACALGPEVKYRYNYGAALFNAGHTHQSKAIFEELLPKDKDERRILYAYGVCCFYTGDKETALKIVDELSLDLICDYVSGSEVADLYFLCGEYEKHNEMYDKERYAVDISWLELYFYSLKSLGKLDEMEQKLAEVTAEIQGNIKEAYTEETDEDYTEQDKSEYTERLQKDLETIITTYNTIKDSGYKPTVKIKLWPMDGCYLIDCPRHQIVT